MSSPKSSANLARWIILVISAFMAIISFLGFLGWWSDPSSQKWWALFCSFVGVAGVVVFWKSNAIPNDEIEIVNDADELIKRESLEEQRRYWKKERRATWIGALVIPIGLALIWLFWSVLREYYWLFGYILLLTLWSALKRLLQTTREIHKLNYE